MSAESIADPNIWECVVTALPFTRHKHLWDPVAADVATVCAQGTAKEVHACIDYLKIRIDFFLYLENNNRNLRHINIYEVAAAQMWLARLHDRLDGITHGRVGSRGGWIAEKPPRKTTHLWLN